MLMFKQGNSLHPGPLAMSSLCTVQDLINRHIPAFNRGEGTEAPWMCDSMTKGAFVRRELSGAEANEDIHVGAFGKEGADFGPGVDIRDR
jgi:hypothetical protein